MTHVLHTVHYTMNQENTAYCTRQFISQFVMAPAIPCEKSICQTKLNTQFSFTKVQV